ncbi:MAG: GNAT family N-acetyltransferase [Actinomycetota bacterium]|jgi:GNAT superfamily N-acetyltransferase|nr:GNAT family N-acetyltransferase [Actinomycetota bacterium]
MADVNVRPARRHEAGEVARIQRTSWARAGTSVIPSSVLDRLVSDEVVSRWAATIEAPPTAGHHVLVAREQETIVGLVAFGPAEDSDPSRENGSEARAAGESDNGPTGEIATLLVEPRWGRRGHGSRLLAATVDMARADGVAQLITWIPENDVSAHTFFDSAGWREAGWVRTLDADGTPLREICLHTSIVEEDPATMEAISSQESK